MKELSQAEIDRRRVQKNNLTLKLDRMLKGFENKFMDAYSTYHFDKVKRESARFNYPTYVDAQEELKGQSFSKLGIAPTYCYEKRARLEYKDSATAEAIRDGWYVAETYRGRLSKPTLLTFEFLKEANTGWTERFERLVVRVLSEAKSTEGMKLTEATAQGGELEILIQQQTQEFHCRFIWVDGVQVAPHHRFIVTTRKI